MNGSPAFPPSQASSTKSSGPSSSSLAVANNPGERKGPKKLIGSLGLVGNGFNWEIPPFPGESRFGSKKEEEMEVKMLANRGTQVEDRDWALLEVEQSGFEFDLSYEGSPTSSSTKSLSYDLRFDLDKLDQFEDEVAFRKNYPKTRCEKCIDRSTYCENAEGDLGNGEKITKLSIEFPLADETHIEEVLNACHGDYRWAHNLMSQFKEEHFINSTSSTAKVNSCDTLEENKLSADSPVDPLYSSSPSPAPTESTNPEKVQNNSNILDFNQLLFGDSNQLTDKQPNQFTFYLDPAFADTLQSSFGQVLKDNEIDEKYLQVHCSSEVAQLIHYLWVKAYNLQSKDKPAKDDDVYWHPDTNNAFSLASLISGNKSTINVNPVNHTSTQKKESKSNVTKEAAIEPRGAFEEIMDLEMAINLSRKEASSRATNSKHAISTKLKRECLRKSYPGLDEKALEELFAATGYQIKETIESVDDNFGLQTTITPEIDALIMEETGYPASLHGLSSGSTYQPFIPPHSHSADEALDQLRNQMSSLYEKRKELSDKGNEAFRAKMYAVASYYKSQAQELDCKIADLRSQLIETVVRANPNNTLDLHGIHTNEVLTTLGSYLHKKYEEMLRRKVNKIRLFIITGRGAHSSSGPRLKPLVLNYLRHHNYKYDIFNPGVISVTLN